MPDEAFRRAKPISKFDLAAAETVLELHQRYIKRLGDVTPIDILRLYKAQGGKCALTNYMLARADLMDCTCECMDVGIDVIDYERPVTPANLRLVKSPFSFVRHHYQKRPSTPVVDHSWGKIEKVVMRTLAARLCQGLRDLPVRVDVYGGSNNDSDSYSHLAKRKPKDKNARLQLITAALITDHDYKYTYQKAGSCFIDGTNLIVMERYYYQECKPILAKQLGRGTESDNWYQLLSAVDRQIPISLCDPTVNFIERAYKLLVNQCKISLAVALFTNRWIIGSESPYGPENQNCVSTKISVPER